MNRGNDGKIMTLDYSYQDKLIKDSFSNLIKHKKSLLAACPGAGKTNMAIAIIKLFLGSFPDARVLVLTHGQRILQYQFAERLHNLGSSDIERITITLPQSIKNTPDKAWDLLVIDEAHHYYGASMVNNIIKEGKIKYELLLTGTPSKFIGKMPVTFITLSELLDKGILTDPDIHLIEVSCFSIIKSDYDKSQNIPMNKITRGHSSDIVASLLKNHLPYFFVKTMIICHNQKQAAEIHKALHEAKRLSYLSISDIGDNSQKTFNDFKSSGEFLVVANRGILGFDYKYLTSVIDLTLTLNINRLFQQICRVVRNSGEKKAYFKIFPANLLIETQQTFLAVVNMANEDGYLLQPNDLKPIKAHAALLKASALSEEHFNFDTFSVDLRNSDLLSFGKYKLNWANTFALMEKCFSYSEFRTKHSNLYKYALNHHAEELRAYYADAPKPITKWQLENAQEAACRCSSRHEFKHTYSGAYKYLLSNEVGRAWLNKHFISLKRY